MRTKNFHWSNMRALKILINLLEQIGSFLLFVNTAFQRMIFPPISPKRLLAQMEFIGVRSLGIIILASLIIGAVFGIQFGMVFKTFGAESLIGSAAFFALSKELAPVVGAFLITGRAGSAIAAEIGTMRVNDQIDAMTIMATNPVGYLASPRILASVIMCPLLTSIFIIFGVISSYIVGSQLFSIDSGLFFDKIAWITTPKDVIQGLQKSMFFGLIFSTIACYKGFQTRGGSKGVGRSTTDAVVLALVSILVSDFFISFWQTRSMF